MDIFIEFRIPNFEFRILRDGLRQLATGEKPSQLSQLSQIKENSV